MIKKCLILIIVSLFLVSCGSKVSYYSSPEFKEQKKSKKIHFMLLTATGAVSINSVGFSNANAQGYATVNRNRANISANATSSTVASSQLLDGEGQSQIAAQNMMFELGRIGFEFVDPDSADFIALFSIGQIRHDLLAGWIADQAFLEFKNPETSKIIISFKVDTRFITPTVNNIVDKLVEEIAKVWGR